MKRPARYRVGITHPVMPAQAGIQSFRSDRTTTLDPRRSLPPSVLVGGRDDGFFVRA